MPRISYVNGRYVHHRDARVHMEDRGYQFSDGIYEVIAFYNRRLLDEDLHIKRLLRSLGELSIAPPMSERALKLVMGEIIARNDRTDGTLYMQISRGVARRDHPFPVSAKPGFVMAVTGPKSPKEREVKEGVSVITAPEQRWARRDIKSVSLLPNVLAKQAATAAGAREAWLVDGSGMISEGAVSNNGIVTGRGEIVTHPLGESILGGITRDVVLRLARKAGMKVTERPFSLKEALAAKEAFLTSTTSNVLPVVKIDGAKVGDGRPGAVTLKLLALYHEHIRHQTGEAMELKKPKAILFDWDNTLVNTWPVIHEALNKTFTELGHPSWSMDEVKQRVARSMRDSFPDIFGKNWESAGALYQQNFRAIHLQRLQAFEGAEATLAFLRRQKPLYMAVVSNKKGVNLRKEVEHIGWGVYFDKVVGADDTPRDKPCPDPVIAALAGSGIAPGADVWFVGDSAVDMECAHATGCVPVWYGELPEKLEHAFHARFGSHKELQGALGALFKQPA